MRHQRSEPEDESDSGNFTGAGNHAQFLSAQAADLASKASEGKRPLESARAALNTVMRRRLDHASAKKR
ncbi:hypothetical protein HDG42_004026 [Paraburkholderia sp. JPY171]|nr:hypothetical protein [Paraburkholderia atlantica]